MSNEHRVKGDNGARQYPREALHAVLRTTRLREMVEWYKTCSMRVLYQNDFLVFMTYDEEHHRIALAAVRGWSAEA